MSERKFKFLLFWSPVIAFILFIVYTGITSIYDKNTQESYYPSFFETLCGVLTCLTGIFIFALLVSIVLNESCDPKSKFRKWYHKHISLW